jgi:hypothetical protein
MQEISICSVYLEENFKWNDHIPAKENTERKKEEGIVSYLNLACLVGGSSNKGMGSKRVWDQKSLVWLEGLGLEHGRGKEITEVNSLITLPLRTPGNSAEIGI